MRLTRLGWGRRATAPVVGAALMILLVLLLGIGVVTLAFGPTDRLTERGVFADEDACPGFQEVEFNVGGEDFDEFLAELQENNCALWLQGGNYVVENGSASQWTDRGPNSFHARQSSPENQPSVVMDAQLNQEVLEFEANHTGLEPYKDDFDQPPVDTTDGEYLDISRDIDALGVTEDSGFVMVAVLKVSAFDRGGAWTVGEAGQDGREFSMRTCGNYEFDECKRDNFDASGDAEGWWRGQHWGSEDVDFNSGTASEGEWVVLTHALDGQAGEVFMHVNGEEIARESVDLDLSGNRDIQIGRWIRIDDNPDYYFDGRMAEVTVFDRTLTPEELETVESYMSSAYGISLDGPVD